MSFLSLRVQRGNAVIGISQATACTSGMVSARQRVRWHQPGHGLHV